MVKIIWVLFMCFFVIGCSGKELETEKMDQSMLINEEDVKSNESSNDEGNLKNEEEKREESSPVIPQPGDGIDLNSLINEYLDELKELYNDDSLTLAVDYQIKYQSETFASIYFSGEISGAAYPRLFKSTLNIDLTTGSRVRLNQKINVDENFIDKVTNHLEEQLEDMEVTLEDVFPMGVAKTLESADQSTTSDVQTYFTQSEVIIIFSVIHALGDYIEVRIPTAAS